jgi:uncharacterized membrane-anchored protein YhcB (DUF1043 family)
MFNIFGKIKDLIIAALVIALPILYIVGRVKGKSAEKNKILKDELEAKEKATDFYKAMAEHEEDGSLDNRSGLTDRLRKDGL